MLKELSSEVGKAGPPIQSVALVFCPSGLKYLQVLLPSRG